MKIYHNVNSYFNEYYFIPTDIKNIGMRICFKKNKIYTITRTKIFPTEYFKEIDLFEFIFNTNLFKKCFNQKVEDEIYSLELLQIYEEVKKELEEVINYV